MDTVAWSEVTFIVGLFAGLSIGLVLGMAFALAMRMFLNCPTNGT